MDNRKTIIVWMDGKKTKLTKDENPDKNLRNVYENNESAAAKEDSNDKDPIPTYIRQNTFEEEVPVKTSKQKIKKTYKHIFIAALSAILLGIGLGIFMLNMFTNIDTPPVQGKGTSDTNSAIDSSKNLGEEVTVANLSTFTLPKLEAYVLQGGLFSEESNAKEIQDAFNVPGFPTMLWKRDNNFYLFTNITKTKEQSDSLKTMYKEANLETYVKKWSVGEAEVELTEAENQWITNYQELWNSSLKILSSNQTISTSDWNKWLSDYPEGGKNSSSFYSNVKGLVTQLTDSKESMYPIFLLEIWKHYENFVME
ncbi:hypothetical protein VBD025_09970 [Virgibacillus flavescens]|uniref:hypothetical protein n=1 Tax=Virgibacillus flavescens TaxID=1611422 RepID=UPI003D341D8F